jgi:hypothetical protein
VITNGTRNIPTAQNSRRGRRAGAGLLGVLVTVSLVLFGVGAGGGVARAATSAARPSVTLNLGSASIASGTQPVVTFVSSGIPAGAVLYLQRASGSSQDWQNVARTMADSGSAKAPADPAGSFAYRLVAVQGNTPIAISAAVSLTVTGPTDSCAICKVAKAALPWLKLLVEPVLGYVVSKVLDWIGMLLGF